ncbi:hypothetical protein N8511_03235, partial [Akkermansiaceae bacterium]|nr:hypothetical protein [Akkermansiaceae bacterium]
KGEFTEGILGRNRTYGANMTYFIRRLSTHKSHREQALDGEICFEGRYFRNKTSWRHVLARKPYD